MLVRALESNWAVLSEEIGPWIPPEIINKEHDDKPEGEEEGNVLISTVVMFLFQPLLPKIILLFTLSISVGKLKDSCLTCLLELMADGSLFY